MARGPLPKPADQRRRRNQPAIPTTNLPRSGRQGAPPRCPYKLSVAGAAWWKWAWSTPQACGWDEVGDLYTVARRAQLEDDQVALRSSSIDLGVDELLDPDLSRKVKELISTLKG